MTYEIKLLKKAVEDIDDICRYLAQFYPGTAGRFLDKLEKEMDNLGENPYLCQKYTEDVKYRRMVIQDYCPAHAELAEIGMSI
jgi:plasmid stabilization system protein ParE